LSAASSSGASHPCTTLPCRTPFGPHGLLARRGYACPALALQAETIIFKDGFALTGTVVRQKKTLVDPVSNTPVELLEGFYGR
jgi:hypothetical protein